MEIIQQLKDSFSTAAQTVRNRTREIVGAIKEFLSDVYHDVVFRLDPGYENSDVIDRTFVTHCHDIVVDVLGDRPFERFASLKCAGRKNAVYQITTRGAEAMGVELDGIEIVELDGLCGLYSFGHNTITLNSNHLYEKPMSETEAKEAIDTIFHELRHAYQRRAACTPSLYGRDKLTAQMWRLNFSQYVSFQFNPTRYFHQPVEQDARYFALSVIQSFSEEV